MTVKFVNAEMFFESKIRELSVKLKVDKEDCEEIKQEVDGKMKELLAKRREIEKEENKLAELDSNLEKQRQRTFPKRREVFFNFHFL